MIPDLLRALIKRFEGLFLKVYRCPAGIPTIGYGHTGKEVSMGMPDISEAVAEAWLEQDAGIAYQQAGKLSPILWLSGDARHSAVADFIFNLGSSRYKASTFRRKVEEEKWDEAAEQVQKWVYGGGRKLPGLVKRCRARAELLNG